MTTAVVFLSFGQRTKEKETLGECAIRRRLKRRITCGEMVGQLDMNGLSFRWDFFLSVGSWVRGLPISSGELNWS